MKSTTTMFNAHIAIAATAFLGACSAGQAAPPSDDSGSEASIKSLRYSFSQDGDLSGEPRKVGTCDVSAPSNVVAFATVTSDPVRPHRDRPVCDGPEPEYVDYHRKFTLSLDGLVFMPSPDLFVGGDTVETFWFDSFVPDGDGQELGKGDTVLVSMRRAGEEWVVMAFVEAESDDEPVNDAVPAGELPRNWPDLVTAVGEVTSNFFGRCMDRAHMGSMEYKRMSDAQFDQFIHSGLETNEDRCEAERLAEPTEDVPGNE